MKTKKLNSLNLNKKSISILMTSNLKGGKADLIENQASDSPTRCQTCQ